MPQGSSRQVLLQALSPAHLNGIRTGSLIRATGSFQAAPPGRRGSGGPYLLASRIEVLAGPPGGKPPPTPGGGGVGGGKPRPPYLVRQPLMLSKLSVLWMPSENWSAPPRICPALGSRAGQPQGCMPGRRHAQAPSAAIGLAALLPPPPTRSAGRSPGGSA